MAAPALSLDNLADFVGQHVGTSAWINVPQSRIDAFAECTGDRQWIHLDVERAKRESPFQSTIAHGYLTLSLLPIATYEIYGGLKTKQSLNYGLDKLRFISPVRAGKRVRAHAKLVSVERRDDGWVQVRTEYTMEIEDEPKPAMVAITIGLLQPA